MALKSTLAVSNYPKQAAVRAGAKFLSKKNKFELINLLVCSRAGG